MRRFYSVLLGVGALATTATVLLRARGRGEQAPAATGDEQLVPHTPRSDGDRMPLATGREETGDVLDAAHTLPPTEAKDARANARHVRHGARCVPRRSFAAG